MADTSCNNSDNLHPSVEEIKPYVAIGPSNDLAITVHKATFDTGFIIFTIIFGAALIALIIITIILAYRSTLAPDPPPGLPLNMQPLTINSNYGASPYAAYPSNKKIKAPNDGSAFITNEDCLAADNTKWVIDHCECQTPFCGESCLREKHDDKFFAVGVPNESTLGMTVINDIMSNGKSFNIQRKIPADSLSTNEEFTVFTTSGSCSDHCNKTPGCNAFIYHKPGMCTLLSDDIIVPKGEGISYSHDIDPILYMRSSDNLHFEDRIFLGEYTWSFPPRYWLIKETIGYAQLLPNIITEVKFYPDYIKMYGFKEFQEPLCDSQVGISEIPTTPDPTKQNLVVGQYTGIYCLHPFNLDNIPDLLQYGDSNQCYIHHPNTILNIPADWKYKIPLYVVYV